MAEGGRRERVGEEQEQTQVEPSELRQQRTFLIFWVCGVVTAFFFCNCRIRWRRKSAEVCNSIERMDEEYSQKRRVTTTFSKDFFIFLGLLKLDRQWRVSDVHSEQQPMN